VDPKSEKSVFIMSFAYSDR